MKVSPITKPSVANQILLMLKSELAANKNGIEQMHSRRENLKTEDQRFIDGFEKAILAVESYIAKLEANS